MTLLHSLILRGRLTEISTLCINISIQVPGVIMCHIIGVWRFSVNGFHSRSRARSPCLCHPRDEVETFLFLFKRKPLVLSFVLRSQSCLPLTHDISQRPFLCQLQTFPLSHTPLLCVTTGHVASALSPLGLYLSLLLKFPSGFWIQPGNLNSYF